MPLPPAPKGRRAKQAIPGLVIWWPLSDGPNSDTGVSGSLAHLYQSQVPGISLTSATVFGALIDVSGSGGPLPAKYGYDRRVSGYYYNNNRNRRLQTTGSGEVQSYQVGPNFSIAVRFYLTAPAGGSGAGLFSHDDQTHYNCALAIDSGNHAEVFFTIAGAFKISVGATVLRTNSWHEIVGTYDNVNLRIYLDGKLDGNLAQTGTPDATAGGFQKWTVGDLGTGTIPVSGYLWSARVFNRTLAASTVRAMWTSPVDVIDISPDPGPVQGGNPSQPNIEFGQSARPIVSTNFIYGYPDPD